MTLEAISPELHKNVAIKRTTKFPHAKNQQLVNVTVAEIPHAALNFPIAAIKDNQTGRFLCVGILGLEEQENLLQDDSGDWDMTYLPLNITRMPFAIGPLPDTEDQLGACLITQSEYVTSKSELSENEKADDLYSEDGKETEFLTNIKKMLGEIYNREIETHKFLQKMSELDLMQAIEVDFKTEHGPHTLQGMYTLNEKKLRELDKDIHNELVTQGFMGPIYSMISSMWQIEKLVKHKNKTFDSNEGPKEKGIPGRIQATQIRYI